MTNAIEREARSPLSAARGRLYEDFVEGETYRHWPGRTVTETDNTWFTLLTMNTHPLHFDRAYAAETGFGQPLVNSCLTLALVTGMSVSDVSQNAVANLGWDSVKLEAPVHIGDTLYAETTVLGKRLSRKRPGEGIVRVRTLGLKADGTVVISFERSILVPLREPNAAAEVRSARATRREGGTA